MSMYIYVCFTIIIIINLPIKIRNKELYQDQLNNYFIKRETTDSLGLIFFQFEHMHAMGTNCFLDFQANIMFYKS